MGKRIILHKKLWHLSILHSLQEQMFERGRRDGEGRAVAKRYAKWKRAAGSGKRARRVAQCMCN